MILPQLNEKSTIGECFGPAMEIDNEADARQYFEMLVERAMKQGNSREESEKIMKSNLGYYSG